MEITGKNTFLYEDATSGRYTPKVMQIDKYTLHAMRVKCVAQPSDTANSIPLSDVTEMTQEAEDLLKVFGEIQTMPKELTSMTDICEAIRENPLLTPRVLLKLRIYPDDGLPARLDHSENILNLSNSISHTTIDVETAGLPNLDSSIDIVTYDPKNNEYWIWDLTSDGNLIKQKIERLLVAAPSARIEQIVICVAVFNPNRRILENDFASRIKSEKDERTGTDSVALVQDIGRKLIKYKDHKEVLKILDPLYTKLLREKLIHLKTNTKSNPIVKTQDVDVVINKHRDKINRILHGNYSGKAADFRDVWRDVQETCPSLYKKFDELIREVNFSIGSLGCSTVDPKTLETEQERLSSEELLCKLDPISWGVYCLTNPKILPEEMRTATRIGLLTNGKFTINSDIVPPDALFNKPQNSRTRISSELICAFKLVIKTQHYFRVGSKNYTFMSKKNAISSMKSLNVPQDELMSQRVRTRGVQVLVNLEKYQDERFHKFIARNDQEDQTDTIEEIIEKEENLESPVEWIDNYEKSLGKVHSLLESDLRATNETKGFDLLSKSKLLLNMRGPRTLFHSFNRSARAMNTPTLRRFLFDYECAKAMSHTFQDKSSANLVYVSNMGMTGGVVINFVNNGAHAFTTTWYKTLVLTDDKEAKLESPGSRISSSPNGDPDFSDFCSNHGGATLKMSGGSVIGMGHAHKWKSINVNQLNWAIESGPKAIGKMASLYEMRSSFYESYPMMARLEMAYSVMPLFVNRQQFSIISNAQRFLHGSLSSSHAEHGAPIGKLKGLRVKTDIESVNFGNMITTYLAGRLLMLSSNRGDLLTGDGMAFTVMPDMLRVTSSAHLSVSCYSTYTYLNADKSERLSSEAECVRNLFDQVDALEKAKESYPDLVRGMSLPMAKDLIEYDGSLSSFLHGREEEVVKYATQAFDAKNTDVFVSDILFQLCTLLDVRDQIGPMDSIFSIESLDISQYFTTKGSIVVDDFDKQDKVKSKRRASAMMELASRVVRKELLKMKPEDLARPFDALSICFALARKVKSEALKLYPNIVLSEKDAAGKDREISTLHIVYSVLCQFTEELAKGISKTLPEDLITTRDKAKLIYKRLIQIQERKRMEDQEKRVLFFASTDKSKFGPNSKTATWFLNAAALAPDLATFEFHALIAQSSAVRKTRFPHHILRQSLEVKEKGIADRIERTSRPAKGAFARGRIGEIMNRIYDHYQETGTKYINVPEGMPGQGIFGINCSVAHSAAMRYIGKVLNTISWGLESVITSDDAMCVFSIPATDTEAMISCLPKFIASTLSLCGLIENMGKYILSASQAEMNSHYFFRGEPIVPVGKFAGALIQERLTANYTDDLLTSVSQGAEMVRKGACLFTACWISAVNMALVIDGHRQWDPLFSHACDMRDHTNRFKRNLWSVPVELCGIPSLDLHMSLLGSSASKLSTFINILRADLNLDNKALLTIDDFSKSKVVKHYVKSLIMSMIATPKKGAIRGIGDTQLGDPKNPNQGIRVKVDEGKYEIRTMPTKSYFPSESGIRGKMKDLTRMHRLAVEFGEAFIKYKYPNFIRPRSAEEMMFKVSQSLGRPLHSGEDSLKPHQIINALNHTHGYRYLDLEANSPMNPSEKERKISKGELVDVLLHPDGLHLLFERYKEHLERVALEYDQLVNQSKWSILGSLYNFYISILKTQISLDGATLVDNAKIKDELSQYNSRIVDQKKKLMVLNRNIKGEISPAHIKRTMMCRYISEEYASKLSIAQRFEYGILGEICEGDMSGPEALETADLCVQRVMARLPRPVSVNCNMSTSSSSSGPIVEFLKRNTMEGKALRFRIEPVREITDVHLDYGSSTCNTKYSRDRISKDLAKWSLGGHVIKEIPTSAMTIARSLKLSRPFELAKVHEILISPNPVTVSPYWVPEGLRRCCGAWVGSYRLRLRVTEHKFKYNDETKRSIEGNYFHIIICKPAWVEREGFTFNKKKMPGNMKLIGSQTDFGRYEEVPPKREEIDEDTDIFSKYYLEDVYSHLLIGPKFTPDILMQLANVVHSKVVKQSAMEKALSMRDNRPINTSKFDPFTLLSDNLQVLGDAHISGNLLYIQNVKGHIYPIMLVPHSKRHLANEILKSGRPWIAPIPKIKRNASRKYKNAVLKNNYRSFLNDPLKGWHDLKTLPETFISDNLQLPVLIRMISSLGAYRPKDSRTDIEVTVSESDSLVGMMVDTLHREQTMARNNSLCTLLFTILSIYDVRETLSTSHVVTEKEDWRTEERAEILVDRGVFNEMKELRRPPDNMEVINNFKFDKDQCIKESSYMRKQVEKYGKNVKNPILSVLLDPDSETRETEVSEIGPDEVEDLEMKMFKRMMMETASGSEEVKPTLNLRNTKERNDTCREGADVSEYLMAKFMKEEGIEAEESTLEEEDATGGIDDQESQVFIRGDVDWAASSSDEDDY